MLLAFSVYPYELLQLSPLLQHVVKLRLVGRNKVQRNELLKPRLPVYGYPRTYASVLLVMIITMVFSSIAPIIMPFSLLYFGLGWVVVRYMAKYVWQAPYESGGEMFDNVVKAIIIGLLIYQLTFIGLFYLKDNPLKGNMAWPLPLFTALFYTYLRKKYSRSYKSLALEEIRSPLIEHAHNATRDDPALDAKPKPLIIESPQYMYAIKGNTYNLANGENNAAVTTDNGQALAHEFDLPTAQFFQQPEYLRARIELHEPHKRDIYVCDGEEDVDVIDEGPYTMHVQSSTFESLAGRRDKTVDTKSGLISPFDSSMIFKTSLAVAIAGVICIIIFREISPPPIIPHA